MKKIRLKTNRLQMIQEQVADLTPEAMHLIQGGNVIPDKTFYTCYACICTQPVDPVKPG